MAEAPAVLALDLGGTKTQVALVRGAAVLEEAVVATDPAAGPEAWIEAAAGAAAAWSDGATAVAAAVTGVVAEGRWSAVNPGTLPIPDAFPLVDRLAARFGRPALALNDAQAAAWGEAVHGAGRGAGSLAFVTLSTGIGGGLVLGGRLVVGRGGLAGSLGAAPSVPDGPGHVEDAVAGRWVAAEAERVGRPADARAVFAAADAGEPWAAAIVAEQARRSARLLAALQLLVDPDLVVVGGGLGLAPGHLARIEAALAAWPPGHRPRLAPAALGPRAGVVGAADLARSLASGAASPFASTPPKPPRRIPA